MSYLCSGFCIGCAETYQSLLLDVLSIVFWSMRHVNRNFLSAIYGFDYFYIALILLWQVLQHFLGVDAKGRIPFMATMLYILISFLFKRKTLFSMPLGIWWIWVVYSLINTFLIQGSSMPSQVRMGFCTSVISGPLLVSAIESAYLRNKNYSLKFISYVIVAYSIVAILIPISPTNLADHGISEFGNIVPITIVFLSFVYSVRLISKNVGKTLYFSIMGFALFAIIVSATRKAFGGVIIVIIFTYLAFLKKISLKTVLLTIIVCCLTYSIASYLENTLLWERFAYSQEKSTRSEYSNNIFLSVMDDRAIMYVEGWHVFLDNMICGIGLKNYFFKGYASFVLHSEYMVQLTECGLIGVSIFLLFYGNLIFKLFRAYKYDRSMTIVCFGGLAAIMFMSFTAWTYSQPVFFVGIGVILSFLGSTLNRKKKLMLKRIVTSNECKNDN